MSEPLRVRPGSYDDPPATSEASTPRSYRRTLLRPTRASSNLPTPSQPARSSGGEMSSAERRRLGIVGSTSRRRQRSDSDDDGPRPESSAPEGRQRVKRRRFHSPPPVPKRQSIRYGYHGQVEPGLLKLELVSCDGGEHRDPRNSGISLGPENILKCDQSVYCSADRTSTIVVRHADDNAFSLEKLHILAPKNGFTAPVRAGVVHVAMNMADLHKYIDPSSHMRRARVPSPPFAVPTGYGSIQNSPERLSLADALRDPEVNAALGEGRQDYGRGADYVHDLAESSDFGNGVDNGEGRTDLDPHCEPSATEDLPNGALARRNSEINPIAFSLVFDEEPDLVDTTSPEIREFRDQRVRRMSRMESLERREDRWGPSRAPPHPTAENQERYRTDSARLEELLARSRVHDDSPPLDDNAIGLPLEAELLERMQRVRHGAEDNKVTTGRFFISRDRSQVTIKFDPPVSGRFIMLRVWSGKSNVDVQSVVAKGYAGPRFFPAKSMR